MIIESKMKKALFTLVAVACLSIQSFGQPDPTLFSVNGKPVTVSEFTYIYSKTNGTKADFSKESVKEYLDLYTKFKMKVARAKEMQLDTIPSLQEELLGYRRQLADSYLTDREVTDKLIREAYDRMQKDVKISHILVAINPKDTLAAWNKIQGIYKELKGGASFESLVTKSEDKNTNQNGGSIGYLTAMLPDGFYALENAMFDVPVGKTSGVIRTPMGYHIVKVNDVRQARGEIEAAHILIRKKKAGIDQNDAKARIDSIYAVLKTQNNFDDLATRLSEDDNSAPKAGYLGVFGIGRYEPVFEDAAFGIDKDGGISKPVESSIGWHIIKRRERKAMQTFDAVKSRLKAQIQREQRYELARLAMVERIKRESGMTENTAVRDRFIGGLDSSFLTYAWRQPTISSAEKIIVFNKDKFNTTSDFSDWLAENSNRRINYGAQFNNNPKEVAMQLFREFLNDKALAYEETQLDKKYPDFRNLMREYEEGILLFEAIKQNVWDKASQDSVGLEKFYAENKTHYQWEERASIISYTVNDTLKPMIDKIKAFAAKNDAQKVLKKFNTKGEYVKFQEETLERSKAKELSDVQWKAGTIVAAKDAMKFQKVDKVMPKAVKSLKEARGYVVAEYQEFLEKQWMEDLTKRFKVETDQAVLNSLIKK
jgi:peptidyl-prolyl cis-trans isomerase SurA